MKLLFFTFFLSLTGCAILFPKKFETWPSPEEHSTPQQSKQTVSKPQTTLKHTEKKQALPDFRPAEKLVKVLLYKGSHSQGLLFEHYFRSQNIKLKGRTTLRFCQNRLCLENANGKTISHKDSLKISSLGTVFSWKNQPYRGNIIALKRGSQLLIINELPLQEYLQGVLPYEIGVLKEWALEALKAQAVAARTYTAKKIGSRKDFDLYSDTRDQVYQGLKSEYPLSNQAVLKTRNLVLKHNGNLISAYYHSTSGGTLASIDQVWGGPKIPYLKAKKDHKTNGQSWSWRSKYSNWKRKYSSQEINSLFSKNKKQAKASSTRSFSRVLSMKVIQRTSSNRVKTLKVNTNTGSFLVHGDKTRWLFKKRGILPSSLFFIKKTGNGFEITGKGFGHGIGMCQMGARERSREGQRFSKILKAYYPNSRLKEL